MSKAAFRNNSFNRTRQSGTGDPAKDVAAVQVVVDHGGAVILVGAFDFGEKRRVTIHQSVSASGEATQGFSTMKSGLWTF